jgi:hypothetical protein
VATEKIFIVGCNRTGTSLVRQILNRSERVSIASETHFLRRFSRVGLENRLEKFGDLSHNSNVHKLIDFMYSGREALGSSYWNWLKKNIDRQSFTQKLLNSDRSERAIFYLLMQVFGEQKEGSQDGLILGEKTPTHYYYIPTLLEWFPQAKIIHTFRDPRAIVVSTIKKVRTKQRGSLYSKVLSGPGWLLDPLITPVETFHISQAWFDAAHLHTRYEKFYPQQYRLVRFEDLINEPPKQIKQICDFLEIPFQEAMLAEVDTVNSSYQAQRHSASGFEKKATERWKEHINPLVKAWFSTMGRKQLKQFGYTP